MTDRHVKMYFGCQIVVEKAKGKQHPYPWRFKVKHNGITHHYAGVPNYCETARGALKRGWYRAKWLTDGSYNTRYTEISLQDLEAAQEK